MTLIDRTASTDHPILDVLRERWSPRAFVPADIDESLLLRALEAARWSPSAYNAQPWRFVVARRGTRTFDAIVAALAEFNQQWAPNASVLVVTVAEHERADGTAQPTAGYDLGQAVAHLTIQAQSDGLAVHQMSGFDADAMRDALDIREPLQPLTVIAIGTRGSADSLPEGLRAGESAARTRKRLAEFVTFGH